MGNSKSKKKASSRNVKSAGSKGSNSGAAAKRGSGGGSSAEGKNSGKKAPRPSLVAQKKVTLEDFELLTTVGKGSFGKVLQVRYKDNGQIYAMKVLKKAQVIKRKQYDHTMAERRILEEIEHPFIVSLRFAFQTTNKLYMVFDFFNGGELFHYLSTGGRFSADRAQFYAAEIAAGLGHLHSLGIIYRDLKPENLILDSEGHIKITDFGLSKEDVQGEHDVKSFCGTPEYLAPEVLKRQPYGKVVDWWSYGTLVYEMIHGLPPYYNRNREKMYRAILQEKLKFPEHMSLDARDFLGQLLNRDPRARLGFNGVEEIKAHPYFSNIQWDALLRKELTPPYQPKVSDEHDTSNIDETFTNMPAAVTMTPADQQRLRNAGNAEQDFGGFTYQVDNVLDGQAYHVSMAEADLEEELGQMNLGDE